MKIQTFSVVVGTRACNAHCPFCVSRMTPSHGTSIKQPEVNWRNFDIGCGLAKNSGVSTVLLTGKGEPTLYVDHISQYLDRLRRHAFPFIELQTNGILLQQQKERYKFYLECWYRAGLTTISISVVHYEYAKNRAVYQPRGRYMDLPKLISFLHAMGFSVRLSCVMIRGGIDSPQELTKLIEFAKENSVEQLSIRPVQVSHKSEDSNVAAWVEKNGMTLKMLREIRWFAQENGKELMRLMHGAVVYDIKGQNLCLTDCLTLVPSPDEVRQLIFFPDGHLRYDWQYPGAILL